MQTYKTYRHQEGYHGTQVSGFVCAQICLNLKPHILAHKTYQDSCFCVASGELYRVYRANKDLRTL